MENLLKIGVFASGIVFQFVLLTYGKFEKSDRLSIFVTFLMGVFVFAWMLLNGLYSGLSVDEESLTLILLVSIPFMALFLVAFFREKMLFVLDEALILLWSIVIFYLVCELFVSKFYFPFIFWPLLLLTLFVVFVNFSKSRLSRFFQVLLSLWFYFILIAFAIMRFPYVAYLMNLKGEEFLTYSDQLFSLPMHQIFVLGSLLMIVYIGLFTFTEFLPGRGTTKKSLKEHVKLLSSRYLDYNSTLAINCSLIFGLGGLFALNYFYGFFDPLNFASLMVFIAYQALYLCRFFTAKTK